MITRCVTQKPPILQLEIHEVSEIHIVFLKLRLCDQVQDKT